MSLLSAFISHQVWLQRNASHEVKELEPFIQQMRDEVRKQVLQFGDDNRTRQNLEKLLRDLEDILDGITTAWQDKLTEDLQALGGYEADWTTKTLEDNVGVDFSAPTVEQVWAAAKWNPIALGDKPADLFGMMAGWGDTEINRLVTGVKMGFVQGKTTRQIVKEVTGPGGLADISQRNAATVIRTALNHVSTQAREVTYKKNNDIVEKYEIIATLDSRTSTICRSLDGQEYEIGKGPLPPFHPNCRTTTAPVISSEFDFLDKGAKRAAKGADGGQQVDASTTYYEFFAKQPAWWQDEAIGPVRGKIFRNSGISPEEFRTISVDGFGRALSLNEMAALDKRVADYLENL